MPSLSSPQNADRRCKFSTLKIFPALLESAAQHPKSELGNTLVLVEKRAEIAREKRLKHFHSEMFEKIRFVAAASVVV